MVLLEDIKNNDQLSLSFRLRGSWLIGKNSNEREIVYKKLKDIYNYRSQVAHSGMLCGNDMVKINKVRDNFENYCAIAEKIIRKIIFEKKPDWSKLILGNN